MRIKLDENLPAGLAQTLAELGHDVDTTPHEGLTGQDDSAIWSAAQDHQRFLITQDLDFSDLRRFQPGTHSGLMLVRLREPSRRNLIERVRTVFREEETVPGSVASS
jgi:predicted nuclease of predicted toxin-antitoxin system